MVHRAYHLLPDDRRSSVTGNRFLHSSRALPACILPRAHGHLRLTFANSEPVGPPADFWRAQPRRHRHVYRVFRLDAYRHLRDQASKICRLVSLRNTITSHIPKKWFPICQP